MVVGPNGAGKTNLLDAIHVGTQGFSLRTRLDVRTIRFGADAARVDAQGFRGAGSTFAAEVTIRPGAGKRIVLNGAVLASAEELRRALPVLVFTPDRLAVVKGGPLVRRIFLDRMIGRALPSRAALPGEYAEALAQRNAALRRVRAGASRRPSVEPWSEAVVKLGRELEDVRTQLVDLLSAPFTTYASRLGLAKAGLRYDCSALSMVELDSRLDRDVERSTTSVGPHLQDLAITTRSREVRAYGSQGEQRLAVLALVLAEAGLVGDTRGEQPLLLLDDVLSELDDARRGALLESVPAACQAVVTATTLRSLPDVGPTLAGVVDVRSGQAVVR
jgi:DNA replication and repair protein RecF